MLEIQEDCLGIVLTFVLRDADDSTLFVDLSGLTGPSQKKVVFYSPTGDINTQVPTLVDVDGILSYTTTASELNVPGDWGVQIQLIYSASKEYRSKVGTIRVVPNARLGAEIAS